MGNEIAIKLPVYTPSRHHQKGSRILINIFRNIIVLYYRPLCNNLNGYHKRTYEGLLTMAATVVGNVVTDLLDGFGARFMNSHEYILLSLLFLCELDSNSWAVWLVSSVP